MKVENAVSALFQREVNGEVERDAVGGHRVGAGAKVLQVDRGVVFDSGWAYDQVCELLDASLVLVGLESQGRDSFGFEGLGGLLGLGGCELHRSNNIYYIKSSAPCLALLFVLRLIQTDKSTKHKISLIFNRVRCGSYTPVRLPITLSLHSYPLRETERLSVVLLDNLQPSLRHFKPFRLYLMDWFRVVVSVPEYLKQVLVLFQILFGLQ